MKIVNRKKRRVILLVFAMKKEFDAFFDDKDIFYTKIDLVDGFSFYKTKINQYTVFAFYSGVGKVSMAYNIGLFNSIIKPDLIINIGVAGSISDQVKGSDLLVATKTCFYDVDLTKVGYKKGQILDDVLYYDCCGPLLDFIKNNYNNEHIKYGLIITGDRFVTSDLIDDNWYQEYDNPVACDMESAVVGQISHISDIDYLIVRSISDDAKNSTDDSDYYEHVEKACIDSASFVKTLLNDLSKHDVHKNK